jgi:TctA family transporter
LSRGDMATFVDRPISMWLLIISALILSWSFYGAFRSFLRKKILAKEQAAAGNA